MPPQITPRLARRAGKFPNRIREYRLKAGLTQRALGTLVGTGRSVISAWERGLAIPRLPTLFRLAKILNTLSEALYYSFYAPGAAGKESRAS